MLPLPLTGNETTLRRKNKMQAIASERIPQSVSSAFKEEKNNFQQKGRGPPGGTTGQRHTERAPQLFLGGF